MTLVKMVQSQSSVCIWSYVAATDDRQTDNHRLLTLMDKKIKSKN